MNPTRMMPCTDHVRKLIAKLLARTPAEKDMEDIFAFYDQMRDDPDLTPEKFTSVYPDRDHCLPIVWLFYGALERNRDRDQNDRYLRTARFLGRVLDGYELKYRLGLGGFGGVYFAANQDQRRTPDRLAIKVVPFDQDTYPNELEEQRTGTP